MHATHRRTSKLKLLVTVSALLVGSVGCAMAVDWDISTIEDDATRLDYNLDTWIKTSSGFRTPYVPEVTYPIENPFIGLNYARRPSGSDWDAEEFPWGLYKMWSDYDHDAAGTGVGAASIHRGNAQVDIAYKRTGAGWTGHNIQPCHSCPAFCDPPNNDRCCDDKPISPPDCSTDEYGSALIYFEGVPHMSYYGKHTFTSTENDLYYMDTSTGGACCEMSYEIVQLNAERDTQVTAIGVDDSGTPHIFAPPFFFSKAGATWNSIDFRTDGPSLGSDEMHSPSMFFEDDKLHLVLVSKEFKSAPTPDSYTVYYVKSSGGSWSSESVATFDAEINDWLIRADIASGGEDEPVIVFYDASGQPTLKYATKDGGSWSAVTIPNDVASTDYGRHPSVGTFQGWPVITYYDVENVELKAAMHPCLDVQTVVSDFDLNFNGLLWKGSDCNRIRASVDAVSSSLTSLTSSIDMDWKLNFYNTHTGALKCSIQGSDTSPFDLDVALSDNGCSAALTDCANYGECSDFRVELELAYDVGAGLAAVDSCTFRTDMPGPGGTGTGVLHYDRGRVEQVHLNFDTSSNTDGNTVTDIVNDEYADIVSPEWNVAPDPVTCELTTVGETSVNGGRGFYALDEWAGSPGAEHKRIGIRVRIYGLTGPTDFEISADGNAGLPNIDPATVQLSNGLNPADPSQVIVLKISKLAFNLSLGEDQGTWHWNAVESGPALASTQEPFGLSSCTIGRSPWTLLLPWTKWNWQYGQQLVPWAAGATDKLVALEDMATGLFDTANGGHWTYDHFEGRPSFVEAVSCFGTGGPSYVFKSIPMIESLKPFGSATVACGDSSSALFLFARMVGINADLGWVGNQEFGGVRADPCDPAPDANVNRIAYWDNTLRFVGNVESNNAFFLDILGDHRDNEIENDCRCRRFAFHNYVHYAGLAFDPLFEVRDEEDPLYLGDPNDSRRDNARDSFDPMFNWFTCGVEPPPSVPQCSSCPAPPGAPCCQYQGGSDPFCLETCGELGERRLNACCDYDTFNCGDRADPPFGNNYQTVDGIVVDDYLYDFLLDPRRCAAPGNSCPGLIVYQNLGHAVLSEPH